ncbi:ABC transporter ATP-binding protein [Glycomyces xiaoerkulensis]|uniref:ABC transporter ATP-binding protein n=1 Tax=Glycomyces xiaoerkulensis TaxID=2038139 RepID=UPI000C25B4C7|nr:ATP-binding cassette domain-containing protein [Glycomyces xiaoerkulensis]
MNGTAKAVEVAGLTKHFGSLRAVDELDFTVEYGSVVGFLGPNGAGKTTTLRCLVGHVRPQAGHALIAGRPYRDLADPVSTVGAVLENGAAHPGRSGRNHLRILARQARIGPERVEAVIDRVGLGDAARRRVGGYSLGMRQRLTLAAALLGDPAVMLLDEPANGLDPEGIRWLREFLRGLAAEGRAVLVSSHGLAELELTIDKAVVIGHGRLIAEQSLSELAAAAGEPQTLITVAEPDRLADVLRRDGHEVLGRDGDRLTVAGDDARTVGRIAFEHGIAVDRLATARPSLEEAYFRLTAGKEAIR